MQTRSTALHIAAEYGDREMVALLLSAGAERSIRDGRGTTPLHLLIESDDPDYPCVKMLIAAGCDVNRSRLADGATPLQLAAQRRSRLCARLLLAAGAKVDARDHGGNTALHVAARLDSLDCAVALLEASANKSLRNKVPGKRNPPLFAVCAPPVLSAP